MRNVLVLLLLFVCSTRAYPQKFRDTKSSSIGVSDVLLAVPRQVGRTVVDVGSWHDKSFSATSFLYIGAYAADQVTTARGFSRCVQCVEESWPLRGERSMLAISGGAAALTLGNLFVADLIKNHVNNRWVRVLRFVGPSVGIALHTRAAIHNVTYPTR